MSNDKKIGKLSNLSLNDIYEYINQKGEFRNQVLADLAKRESADLTELDSDIDRTKLILFSDSKNYKTFGNLQILLEYIDDLFCKCQLVKAQSDNDYKIQDLIAEIDEYEQHLNIINNLNNEREKADYIASIDNNEMKQALLGLLEQKENRRIVIDSLHRKVNPEIAEIDELVRTMIQEYFEDNLGDEFSEEKMERLRCVFARTSVCYEQLDDDYRGGFNAYFNKISISNNLINDIDRIIGYLCHEYEHSLSMFDFIYNGKSKLPIEEGMADTFAETVISHYMSKHREICINGQRIAIEIPYSIETSYDYENSLARTMLAGLESNRKDTCAIIEYVLGDKREFVRLVWGNETFENEGEKRLEALNIADLCNSTELDYSSIDESFIYYRRNTILPLFKTIESFFHGRKFYDVPDEELESFLEQIYKREQPESNYLITSIEEKAYKLTEQEIYYHSFEILLRLPAIFGMNKNNDSRLEELVRKALESEKRKIENGQTIDETNRKRDEIQRRYQDSFKADTNSNLFIKDALNSFYDKVDQEEETPLLAESTVVEFARTPGVPTEKNSATRLVANLGKEPDRDIEREYGENN